MLGQQVWTLVVLGKQELWSHHFRPTEDSIQLHDHVVDSRDFLANSFPTGNDIMASSNSTDYTRIGILLGPSNNNKHKENNLAKILKQNMKNKRI